MKKNPQISNENFESLLNWFSTDSEEAGLEFEKIREGLVRFFRFRGCNDSMGLADETMNRVVNKFNTLDLSRGSEKITIFYGFARFVYHEYLRDNSSKDIQLDVDFPMRATDEGSKTDPDDELECLDRCLDNLSSVEKQLIVSYFSKEKAEKILLRKKIMEDLDINANALHVRVYRIKEQLKNCIENCLKKKLVRNSMYKS